MIDKIEFFAALKERSQRVMGIIHQERFLNNYPLEVLRKALFSYLSRPAKHLRPGILYFSCGALGGTEAKADYAAAAVEVFHNWTLVHDDLIDNDTKRRGLPTVHEEYRKEAVRAGYSSAEAVDFGRSIAILTGDLQQAFVVSLLLETAQCGVAMPVVMELLRNLTIAANELLRGEALDIIYSKRKITELTEAEIMEMLELKTGVLYEYAAVSGAAIGLNQEGQDDEKVRALGRFARRCGISFQLQDDLLGITGDEKVLGKPVGSDIREGKRTVIVSKAYEASSRAQRYLLDRVLGNPQAGENELLEAKGILIEKGLDYTKKLAENIVDQAIAELSKLPKSIYKEYLLAWAEYVIKRDF